MYIRNITITCLLGIVVGACNTGSTVESGGEIASDPHTFARPDEARTVHLSLDLTLDFDTRTIQGIARHTIAHDNRDSFIVDTRDLTIEKVTTGNDNTPVDHAFTEEQENLGRGLKIPIDRSTRVVTIHYTTSPVAAALGWLDPIQTEDKTMPFLYTQGQAILTRTWIPLQDSPGIRFTYDAQVTVPSGMLAVMSAENPVEKNPDGVYNFTMEQPIPGYLIALAAGDIVFGEVGPRTGVYAEPSVLDRAVYEFGEMEQMLEIAEGLYGPYLWERYDVIVLPPSFPFGGMENPRLTFVTPTILAGDRSLVALIAHELAHSWSGNLVTNATWNDFWLNEGFTVYFESRIMEALYGEEYNGMLRLLGRQDLEKEVADLGSGSADTHLFLDLEGRDPDAGMTAIAYEKGALFLRLLEAKAGREIFDAFLKQYFDEHQFKSMTTSHFVDYLNTHLIEPNDLDVNVDAWIYGPGIPDNAPVSESDRFERVDTVIAGFMQTGKTDTSKTNAWTTHEWLHFIRNLPDSISTEQLKNLDTEYGLHQSGNAEIAAAWYEVAIRRGYAENIIPSIETFLVKVGRRKFLMPIYLAMKESGMLETAQEIYSKARPNYHSVSRNSLDELLNI